MAAFDSLRKLGMRRGGGGGGDGDRDDDDARIGDAAARPPVVLRRGRIQLYNTKSRSWKLRLVIVDTNYISHYDSEEGAARGVDRAMWRLHVCDACHADPLPPTGDGTCPPATHAISIVPTGTGKTTYVRAETQVDRDAWLTAAQLAIELAPPAAVGIRHGFLSKKGARHHNWKRRWIVLTHTDVSYYESKGPGEPLGSIPIADILGVEGASATVTSKRDAVAVVTASRTYVFRMEGSDDPHAETLLWMRAIGSLAALVRRSGGDSGSAAPLAGASTASGSSGSGSGSTPGAAGAAPAAGAPPGPGGAIAEAVAAAARARGSSLKSMDSGEDADARARGLSTGSSSSLGSGASSGSVSPWRAASQLARHACTIAQLTEGLCRALPLLSRPTEGEAFTEGSRLQARLRRASTTIGSGCIQVIAALLAASPSSTPSSSAPSPFGINLMAGTQRARGLSAAASAAPPLPLPDAARAVREAAAQVLVLVRAAVSADDRINGGKTDDMDGRARLLRDIVLCAKRLRAALDVVLISSGSAAPPSPTLAATPGALGTEAEAAATPTLVAATPATPVAASGASSEDAEADRPARVSFAAGSGESSALSRADSSDACTDGSSASEGDSLIDVAREAIAATRMIANAATGGSDAQLVQAVRIHAALVRRLIAAATSIAATVSNAALRDAIVAAHGTAKESAVAVVLAAKGAAAAVTIADRDTAAAALAARCAAAASAARGVVALAGVVGQHRRAMADLAASTALVKDSVAARRARLQERGKAEMGEAVIPESVDAALVASGGDLVSGLMGLSKMLATGSTATMASGLVDPAQLNARVSDIARSVYSLLSATSNTGDAVADPGLHARLQRASNAIKDVTVRLHAAVRLIVEGTTAADDDARVLAIATACRSVAVAFANVVDTIAYVETESYVRSSEPAVSDANVNIWDEVPDCPANILFADAEPAAASDTAESATAAVAAAAAAAAAVVAAAAAVESAGDEDGVRKSGGLRRIRAATLNKLVARLTAEAGVDLYFVKAFLTTYRSFTTPYQLFQKLVQRYQVPAPDDVTDLRAFDKSVRVPIQLRVCNVISQWVDGSYHDFDDELVAKMRVFFETNVQANTAALATKLIKLLARKKREAEEAAAAAGRDSPAGPPVAAGPGTPQRPTAGSSGTGSGGGARVGGGGGGGSAALAVLRSRTLVAARAAFGGGGEDDEGGGGFAPTPAAAIGEDLHTPQDVLDRVDAREIAVQLTLREFTIYSEIRPVELLRQAWSKEKLRHLAPNVTTAIARFNELSAWVSASIVALEKLKQRGKIMLKWVNVAVEMHKLNNFNSLLAIISGLNNAAVHRLKFTKADLPKKPAAQLRELEVLMSNDKSYANYRAGLHNINPPCVPYLGVYLTDLTFIEDGNPDEITGLINFKKRELVYNVIAEVKQYQQTRYSDSLKPNLTLIALFEELPMEDDKVLYNASLVREPRGADVDDIE